MARGIPGSEGSYPMRIKTCVSVLAVPLLLAACMEDERPAPMPGPLPGGSWQQSCRDGQVRNGTLRAQCLTANNTYRPAVARIGNCRAFGNRNGTLFCETNGSGSGGGWGGGETVRWTGSFERSCRDSNTDRRGTLTARCESANGDWRRTSISPRQCPSYRAGNRDGRLFCER